MENHATALSIDLFNNDCRETVSLVLPDNSVDTIITDPPYGLEFMGKGWDKGVPGVDFWKAFLSVTKPGGMLLAFGGTRTFHRMTCAIEDAGWEIRDCMMWLYGSGFPKSHNFKEGKFKGWGTALKPAWEPIIVAMKPLDGTFAENAEKWGVAGLNVNGGRIGTETVEKGRAGRTADQFSKSTYANGKGYEGNNSIEGQSTGRWPANLVLDEEAGAMLDGQSGVLHTHSGSGEYKDKNNRVAFGKFNAVSIDIKASSSGASRFFYCAKASKSERGLDNVHPTVKPLKLMEYLCTLTKTPTGGVVLDPFMGSGTTGIAAKNTGRSFIGIEQNADYFKIAEARILAK